MLINFGIFLYWLMLAGLCVMSILSGSCILLSVFMLPIVIILMVVYIL